jgi:hypothetical protein
MKSLVFGYLVDPNKEIEDKHFRVYGTGWDIDAIDRKLNYVGNLSQILDGTLVFHLFEEDQENTIS